MSGYIVGDVTVEEIKDIWISEFEGNLGIIQSDHFLMTKVKLREVVLLRQVTQEINGQK